MKKKLQITILFGTEKDVKKTYVFENETQKEFFIKGVDEANGYLFGGLSNNAKSQYDFGVYSGYFKYDWEINPKIKPSKGLEKSPAAIKNDPIPRNPLIEPFLKFFFFLDFV